MVIVENSQDGQWARIQARSHFSLGIGGLLTLLVTLSGLTLLLATVAAWQGYWPILVIAVLQVVVLGRILVRAWKASWSVETITIDPISISILHQQYSETTREALDTAWARVVLGQPANRWYAPALWLRSGEKGVELGTFLTAEEKHEFATALHQAIAGHSAWQHQRIETEVI